MHPLRRSVLLGTLAVAALVALLELFGGSALAQQARDRLERRRWEVDGIERVALVALPRGAKAPEGGSPLVFVFHGHGGSARNVAAGFAIHERWPEAIVVYPEGLPTPGRLTDPEGKKQGWQPEVGAEADRDLHFFDTMFESLSKDLKVDLARVYATGHSNGGQFTYILWQARIERFAAVAPSASGSRIVRTLKPLPAMHLAGEKDTLVPFANQSRVMEAIRDVNGCAKEGKSWAKNATLYESATGTPVVTYIHPGGHEFVRESASLIVRFFKDHRKAGDLAKPAQLAPISAFYIGHSLNSDIPDMVAAFAKGTVEFSFREQFIPGAPLRWQWDEQAKPAAERATFGDRYRVHWFDAFPKGDLTALVLVDSVPRGPQEMPETIDYAGRLIGECLKTNPKATIYLYEPWHCTKSGTPDGCAYDGSSPTRTLTWVERLEADRAMWDGAVKSLRSSRPTATIALIPAGRAFAVLARAIERGEVDGFKRFDELLDDDIHPNPYGKYFVACVHYAVLTGRSPEGLPMQIADRWGGSYWNRKNWQQKEWAPPSAKAIAAMQRIAWQVVRGEGTKAAH